MQRARPGSGPPLQKLSEDIMTAASVEQASAKAAEEHRKAEAHAAREQELWAQARATGNDASRIASSKVHAACDLQCKHRAVCVPQKGF